MSKLNINERIARISPDPLLLYFESFLFVFFALSPGLSFITALVLGFLSFVIQRNFPLRPKIATAKLLKTLLWLLLSACFDFLLFFGAIFVTFAPFIGPTNIYGAVHEVSALSLQLAAAIAIFRGFYVFMGNVFFPFMVRAIQFPQRRA